MNGYLNYIIESNFCLVVFMLLYATLFRNETDFNMKRMVLLGGIGISILFPLFHIESTAIGASFSEVIPTLWLPEISVGAHPSESKILSSGISWIQAGIYIYMLGILFFFIKFTFQLIKIVQLIKKSVFVSSDKLRISESVVNIPSFSFFNYISIGNAPLLSEEEKIKIIKHESIHAKRFHSFDILLLNILKIFFWFNPIIGTYKKILIELHEFEADARAVETDAIHDYCNLLAKVALMSADLRLANCFTNSLTLKRIEMIRKIKLKISRWKLLAICASLPLLFSVIACQDQVATEAKEGTQSSTMSKNNENLTQLSQDDEVFTIVDETASPQGGIEELYKFIGSKLLYPRDAKTNGIEGRVFVEFIVEKDGSVTNVTVVKGVDPLLNKAAADVVSLFPKWVPGKNKGEVVRQKVVLPVAFKLG
jgi:TonB family protein